MTVTHVKYRATKPLVIILSYCLVLLYSGALKLCMMTLHVVQRKRRLSLPGELFLRKLDSNSEHKETSVKLFVLENFISFSKTSFSTHLNVWGLC